MGSQLQRLLVTSLLLIGLAAAHPAAAGSGGADMSITKSATPNPAVFGQKLTYEVLVTNNGPGVATNVVGADRLPPEVKFESAKATKGGACFVTSLVQCPIGEMGSGETVTMTIVVTVVEMPFEGDFITNFCSVFSDNDPNDENSHCRVLTKVVVERGGGEEPCIPERAFTEIDSMKNFLRKTIKRVEQDELSGKELQERTKVLDKSKLAMLRKHFPTVFGQKFISVFLQLEGFDSKMETVRDIARGDVLDLDDKRIKGPAVRTLKRAQKELRDLEAVLK